MKKMMILLFVLLLTACERQVEWPLSGDIPDMIVVDGMITDDKNAHQVRLSRPVAEINGAAAAVTGAIVSINDGFSTLVLKEDNWVPGLYKTDSNFAGIPGRTYALSISYNGSVYTASSFMRPGVWFTPLRYSRINKTGRYKIDWVTSPYNAANPAMYEILLDWSGVPGYVSSPYDSTHARMFYFSLPTLDVSEIFAPEMERITFPRGTLITERRYSLNNEHAEYLRALLLETSWRGGLYDMQPAQLPTNLSQGAVGYFSACGVTSVSLTVGE